MEGLNLGGIFSQLQRLLKDPDAVLLLLLILLLGKEEKNRGLILALAFLLLDGGPVSLPKEEKQEACDANST